MPEFRYIWSRLVVSCSCAIEPAAFPSVVARAFERWCASASWYALVLAFWIVY
jgi:hypothetical protein